MYNIQAAQTLISSGIILLITLWFRIQEQCNNLHMSSSSSSTLEELNRLQLWGITENNVAVRLLLRRLDIAVL